MAGLPLPGGDTSARDALAAQLRAQYNTGQGGTGSWDDAGFDRAAELADMLLANGITSLGDLSFVDTPYETAGQDAIYGEGERDAVAASTGINRKLKIGDQEVGFLGDYNNDGSFGSNQADYLKGFHGEGDPAQENLLGWSARGDGNTSYRVITDPTTGKLVIAPGWNSSSDAANVRNAAIAAAAMYAGGYGLSAMGGTVAAEGALAASSPEAFGLATQTGLGAGGTYSGGLAGYGLTDAAATSAAAGSASGGGEILGSWGEWGFDAGELGNMIGGGGAAAGGAKSMGWMDVVQAGIGVGGLVKDYLAVDAATDAASDANETTKEISQRQLDATDAQYQNYLKNFQPLLLDSLKTSTDNAKTTQEQSNKLFGLTYDDAERYSKRWQDVQVPLEDEIIGNARMLGTKEEQDRITGLAMADTRQAYAAMQEQSNRDSARRGVNPNSGAAAALAQQAYLSEALALSGNANSARFAAQDRYRAGLTDAAALGRGLPGFSSSAANSATGAGSLGVSGGSAGTGNITSAVNANTNALNGFTTGWNGAANSASGGINGVLGAGQLSNNSALSTLAGYGWSNWAKPRGT